MDDPPHNAEPTSATELAALHGLQQLSELEAAAVFEHLRTDTGGAGPQLAHAIADQGGQLYSAMVAGLEATGGLVTIWTNLAGVTAQEKWGHPCFLVAEAVEALSNPAVPTEQQPKDDLATIQAMVGAIEDGTYTEPRIVLAATEQGLYIADGNKTAVAFFEHGRRNKLHKLELPVILPIVPADTADSPSR